MQAPGVFAVLYVKSLFIKTPHCWIYYDGKKVMLSFVKDLDESTCDSVRVNLGQSHHSSLTEMACYVDKPINSFDRSFRIYVSSRDALSWSVVKCNGFHAHVVKTSNHDSHKITSKAPPLTLNHFHDSMRQPSLLPSSYKTS